MKLDEAQLSEQEALRKQLQQEQDLLQKFQESQEKKLLTQHDREKRALDEKVETSKRELEKRVSHPSHASCHVTTPLPSPWCHVTLAVIRGECQAAEHPTAAATETAEEALARTAGVCRPL